MSSIKFTDSQETHYRICDCCGEAPHTQYLHWDSKDFSMCFICIERQFVERVAPFIKENLNEKVVVTRGTISEEVRNKILSRDNHTCVKCGNNKDLTIDHIIPFSCGGKTDEANLQVLCRSCNSKKGNTSLVQG